jgi:hypothetical protein
VLATRQGPLHSRQSAFFAPRLATSATSTLTLRPRQGICGDSVAVSSHIRHATTAEMGVAVGHRPRCRPWDPSDAVCEGGCQGSISCSSVPFGALVSTQALNVVPDVPAYRLFVVKRDSCFGKCNLLLPITRPNRNRTFRRRSDRRRALQELRSGATRRRPCCLPRGTLDFQSSAIPTISCSAHRSSLSILLYRGRAGPRQDTDTGLRELDPGRQQAILQRII